MAAGMGNWKRGDRPAYRAAIRQGTFFTGTLTGGALVLAGILAARIAQANCAEIEIDAAALRMRVQTEGEFNRRSKEADERD